jgi:hypothetical protein
MSESFCNATTVCYQEGVGAFVCDDLGLLGVTLDNNNTYTIEGLLPNTSYNVYFTTADDTSVTVSITTADCSSEIAGCTDTNADNYDPAATLDDGSCTYTCFNVTLTIDTDCWGGETGWTITDDLGNVVASVAAGTYGNQATFTWNDCLNTGCYVFNITDTFGDGLFGTGSGCAVDGNYSMVDDLGNVLFQMGDPNFGSGTSHNFCLPFGGALGCTDTNACNYDPVAVIDDGTCILPPSNDLCANASSLSAGTTAITNVNACNNEGAAGSCHFNGDAEQLSVWYEFTTPANPAEITIETTDDGTGSWNDTQFTLFDVCGGTELACDDDAGVGLYSLLTFACGALTPNTTYLLQVDGWNFSTGTCDITLTMDEGPCGGVSGCTNPVACNYDPAATIDDGSCQLPDGCTNASACNFNPAALCDDGSCELPDGCTNATACNYNPAALCDDGSCQLPDGCTNATACNYNPAALCDDGTCQLPDGCTNVLACNYNPAANCDDGSCLLPDGCTNVTACNYNPAALCDDGSCQLPDGCTDNGACNYDPAANCDDGSCEFISCLCAEDLNGDGTVDVQDLLIFLSDFGCVGAACIADFNGSGATDAADLLTFLGAYGTDCP